MTTPAQTATMLTLAGLGTLMGAGRPAAAEQGAARDLGHEAEGRAVTMHEVSGTVSTTRSRWTDARDTIVTEAYVQTSAGKPVRVLQLGGAVDGIGIRYSHQPPPLRAGDMVTLTARSSGRPGLETPLVVADVAVFGAEPIASQAGQEPPATAEYGLERTWGSNTSLWRASGCMHFVFDDLGTSHVADDGEFDLLEQGFATWIEASDDCSVLNFTWETDANIVAGRDGRSTVHFREQEWCRPASGAEPEICHSPQAAAVTRLVFVDAPGRPSDGLILETDIEFNAVDFDFSRGDEAAGHGLVPVDLLSVATHEIGHALGITHNCWTGAERQPLDESGRSVPSCLSIDPASPAASATMYFDIAAGETHKRSLEPADRHAVCVATAAQSSCGPAAEVIGGGCQVGASGVGGADSLWLGAVLLLLRLRRSRR